jgi:hypothetical protein
MEAYEQCSRIPSDMNEHAPKLREIARDLRIVEFGIYHGVSAISFLAGGCKSLTSYDIVRWPVVDFVCKICADRFQWICQDCQEADIPLCDLLLEDSWHDGMHVRKLLRKHAPKVQKYLVFHDTHTYGKVGSGGGEGIMLPILEFLADQWPAWDMIYRVKNNHGLVILERQ